MNTIREFNIFLKKVYNKSDNNFRVTHNNKKYKMLIKLKNIE